MSINEATNYVDIVVEELVKMGVISEEKYGRMTEDQREKLAELVQARSEE